MKSHWEDEVYAVVTAGDWPAHLARSRTRKSIAEAIKAEIHPKGALPPVGLGSRNDYIKVYAADLESQSYWERSLARVHSLPNNRVIPEWPLKCPTCGRGMIQLFTSIDHEGGPCRG